MGLLRDSNGLTIDTVNKYFDFDRQIIQWILIMHRIRFNFINIYFIGRNRKWQILMNLPTIEQLFI